MRKGIQRFVTACLAVSVMGSAIPWTQAAQGDSGTVSNVKVDLGGTMREMSPNFYGSFIEDINNGVEGGLYAELVRNRSFEDHYNDYFFRFDAEAEGKISDSAGSGTQVELKNGATLTDGKFGKGLTISRNENDAFENQQYATLPLDVADSDEITVATWIKPDMGLVSPADGQPDGENYRMWARVFDIGGDLNTACDWMSLCTRGPIRPNGRMRFVICVDGVEQEVGTDQEIPRGEWAHVAVTLSAHTAVMYINGREVARNEKMTFKPSDLKNITQAYLGRSTRYPDPGYLGQIDDFRIYHRALSGSEVNAVANDAAYKEFGTADAPRYWSLDKTGSEAAMTLDRANLLNDAQKAALKLTVGSVGADGRVALKNEGYSGIAVKKDTTYDFSAYLKKAADFTGPVTVSLESADGSKTYASGTVTPDGADWKKYTLKLTANADDVNARLVISVKDTGTLWLDMVSLFPPTYKGRANGANAELAGRLEDLGVKFFRFAGGSLTQGWSPETAYDFSKTIGPVEERPSFMGYWGYENTNGFGMLENLQLAEDLGAEPILVVNCGRGYNWFTTADELDPYIQSALDAIEYANGGADTTWGAKRIADGHAEPFGLKHIEIGNEDGNDPAGSIGINYADRFKPFYTAIKEKYPEMNVISNGGTADMKSNPEGAPMWDFHKYASPNGMFAAASEWDSYDRTNGKVFAGEVMTNQEIGKGNMLGATADAAYLTGLERNSDVIEMFTMAPFFSSDANRQWPVNVINFSNTGSYVNPSYYVQKMFAENRGNKTFAITADNNTQEAEPIIGQIGFGSWFIQPDFGPVKVTAADGSVLFSDDFTGDLSQWNTGAGTWELKDGRLYQKSDLADCAISTKENIGTQKYTITTSVNRPQTNECALIKFGYKGPGDYLQFGIGTYGGGRCTIEEIKGSTKTIVSERDVPADCVNTCTIRIEVDGSYVECYANDKLMGTYGTRGLDKAYYVGNYDEESGDVLIKAVNSTDKAIDARFNLENVEYVSPIGSVTVLKGAAEDTNTVANPEAVAPQEKRLTGLARSFTYTLEPYSVQVIRLHTKNESGTQVALDPTAMTLKVDASATIKATVVPETAAAGLAWKSDNETVAKVDQNGKVTALKAGTAVITATTQDGSSDSCVVKVVSEAYLALEAAVEEYQGYSEWDYTADSWKGFQSALDAAADLLGNPATPDATLQAALEAIRDAEALLVTDPGLPMPYTVEAEAFGSNTGVKSTDADADDGVGGMTCMVGEAGTGHATHSNQITLKPGKYTVTLRMKLLSEPQDADKRIANFDLYYKTTEDKFPAMKEIMASDLKLNEYVELTLPFTLTETAENMQSRLWFDDNASWKIDKFVFDQVVDKDALNALIEACAQLQEVDYTVDSWKTFKEKLDAAKAVADKDDATQTEVNTARKDLEKAKGNLVKNPAAADKDALNALIEACAKLQEKDYTADSWKVFKEKLDAAKVVADKDDAIQSEVDTARTDLETAKGNLVKNASAVDKSALAALIEDCAAYKQSDYTSESWAVFSKALTEAKSISAKADATQQQVDAAKNALDAAKKALVKAVVPAQNGWKKIDTKWYYFEDGVKQTGWKHLKGIWYYLGTDGVMATGWYQVDGKWYFSESSGKMVTGWKKLGKWYYFGTDGALKTGWYKVGSKWYFAESSGKMVTGWKKLGKWYYFGTDGAMKTGWYKVGSKWYFSESSGKMVTGWKKLGKWYYFGTNGAMKTGWTKVGNAWYYMDGSGRMLASVNRRINGKTYRFASSGKCLNP